jgi:nicotinate-nucleotide adenylyltransferase
MQIAVYGGSFNPPHIGHAMVASYLWWTGKADQVWLVPAFDHAFDKALAPFELRLELCRKVAYRLGPWCQVSNLEASLSAPSYTIQTLDALSAIHPEHRFHWVAGADILATLHLWKDWKRIKNEYGLILVGRAGYPEVQGAPVFPDFSSTEIRNRLKTGEPVDSLVDSSLLPLLLENKALF